MYSHKVIAQVSDIDILNHVNNEVYLRWLMEAAVAHSDHLGFPVSKYNEIGSAFVVRRHEIDYLASANLNEELEVQTWCGEIGGTKAIRKYKIIRIKDQKTLIEAQSVFVFISLKNGKPQPIPESICRIFASTSN